MTTTTSSNSRVERYSFTSAALAVAGVVVLVGMAPRNQRALFLRDDAGVQAKAFAAVVPPLDAVRAQLERGALNDVAYRSARSGAGRLTPGNRRFVSSGTELIPGTVPALLANGPRGAAGSGLDEIGNPAGGAVANAATPGIVTPSPTGGEAPGGSGGGGGVGPAGITPPSPGGPGATALPEPATWGMMLIGFLAIGGALRRPTARRIEFNA